MTNSEDKTLRIFDLNNEMLNTEEQNVNELVKIHKKNSNIYF